MQLIFRNQLTFREKWNPDIGNMTVTSAPVVTKECNSVDLFLSQAYRALTSAPASTSTVATPPLSLSLSHATHTHTRAKQNAHLLGLQQFHIFIFIIALDFGVHPATTPMSFMSNRQCLQIFKNARTHLPFFNGLPKKAVNHSITSPPWASLILAICEADCRNWREDMPELVAKSTALFPVMN